MLLVAAGASIDPDWLESKVRTNPEMVAALRGRDTLVPESLPVESASARPSLAPEQFSPKYSDQG